MPITIRILNAKVNQTKGMKNLKHLKYKTGCENLMNNINKQEIRTAECITKSQTLAHVILNLRKEAHL